MPKQYPQTAYRKYAVLTGTIFEKYDKTNSDKKRTNVNLDEE